MRTSPFFKGGSRGILKIEMKNITDTPGGKRIAEGLLQEMDLLKKETGYQFHDRG